MPRNLPQYTKCAPPGAAHAMDAGSIAMLAFVALVGGGIGASVMAIVMAMLGQVAAGGCILGAGIGAFLIMGVIDFKDWYYNYRLMCIQPGQCACGTVVGKTETATDGDRKVEILIAPFSVPETEQLLIQTLVDKGAAGELANVPDAIDLANRQVLFGYVRGLSHADQVKVYLELTENRMFSDPARRYLRHLYRRDEAVMGTPAFANSPDDAMNAPDPNPMFRINPEEGADPEEKVLVPYMHCEVEGNRLGRWLDNVLVGLVAGLAAFVALCVACAVISMGALTFLCGWVGAALAALIAFLAWLISHLVNDPDDAVASEVDVDVQDPSFDTPPSEAREGDVVYLFGDWVMDEEHGQYFEIHPVKAWYLLCRNEKDPEGWQLTEEVPASECSFDVTTLTSTEFEEICRVVKAVENTDPDDSVTVTHAAALTAMPPVR